MRLAMADGPGAGRRAAVPARAASFSHGVLPWSAAAVEDRRFIRILRGCLLLALTWAVVLPLLKVALPERGAPQPLPPPIARLMLERPAPPPPVAPLKPAGRDAAAREQTPPAITRDTRTAARRDSPRPSARQPVPGRDPGAVALDQARRKAAGSGLLALKNELSALVSAPTAVQWKADAAVLPGVGTTAGRGAGAGSDAGEPVRALVLASAGRGSGGIDHLGSTSRDSGGGGLPGRGTTLLDGSGRGGGGGGGNGFGGQGLGGNGSSGRGAGGGADSGSGGGGADAGTTAGKAGASARAARSIEDIKLVFERHKGAIYAIYNRALRDDPTLQGKLVLELKIAPGGQVSGLRIVSSELKSEDLERKLLARIRSFDFGAKDVDVLVLTWPVDFLPS